MKYNKIYRVSHDVFDGLSTVKGAYSVDFVENVSQHKLVSLVRCETERACRCFTLLNSYSSTSTLMRMAEREAEGHCERVKSITVITLKAI